MDLQIASVFLELLFVFVILAALCHQRERIGVAPVTMAYGTMMLFGVLMNAAEIYAPLPWGGQFNVAQTAIFLPLLAAFLMIYISLGVLKAQRLLLGIVVCFLLCIYFVMLIRMQCRYMPPGALRDVVKLLLSDGTASVNLSAVSNLISLFTLPMLYSGCPRRLGRTLRIIISMLAALLLGGAYLVYRKVISLRIPVAYLGTVALLTLVFSKTGNPISWMLYSLLSGGLMLGAIFMATDYATSPATPVGQVLYGIGCGVLTVVFRYFGLFPEGVTYAILLMNALVWFIDRHTAMRRFGTGKGGAAK
jgi:hypothetical protein